MMEKATARMRGMSAWGLAVAASIGLSIDGTAHAQDGAAAIAKALQDPLASISALMTDNTINFDTGPRNKTGYNFQLQPVYSIPFETFNFIPRAIIPFVGAPGGADFPNLGPPQPEGDSVAWGLSDITAQFFFNPKSDAGWKWGIGPQFSLRTRTDSAVAGPGWGAGAGGVLVGGTGNFSFAFLLNQHWSYDGDFSLATFQPGIFYNVEALPGFSIHYNNAMTVDWKANSGDAVTLPLGLGVSQSFDMGGGYGLDIALGAYGVAVRPDNGPSWQLKFGISVLIPR